MASTTIQHETSRYTMIMSVMWCVCSLCNPLEALFEMGLHSSWVLGLGEDLKHLVIREEEEPWKEQPLLLEVGIQPLQDLVQEVVATTQLVKETRLGRGRKDLVGWDWRMGGERMEGWGRREGRRREGER